MNLAAQHDRPRSAEAVLLRRAIVRQLANLLPGKQIAAGGDADAPALRRLACVGRQRVVQQVPALKLHHCRILGERPAGSDVCKEHPRRALVGRRRGTPQQARKSTGHEKRTHSVISHATRRMTISSRHQIFHPQGSAVLKAAVKQTSHRVQHFLRFSPRCRQHQFGAVGRCQRQQFQNAGGIYGLGTLVNHHIRSVSAHRVHNRQTRPKMKTVGLGDFYPSGGCPRRSALHVSCRFRGMELGPHGCFLNRNHFCPPNGAKTQ